MKTDDKNIYNEENLKLLLAQEFKGGLYFIYGKDNFLKVYYANEIAKKAVGSSFEEFNLHRFDGFKVTVDEIGNAVESVPMFSEGTCVLINDLDIFHMDATNIEKIMTIVNDVPDTCALILLMDTIEKGDSKQDKTKDKTESNENDGGESESEERKDAKKVWDDILSVALSQGYAIELNGRSSVELVKLIMAGSKKRGHKIDEKTARYFIESIGFDIANLQSELDKVCSYANGDLITYKEIDSVSVKTIEANVFHMATHLIEKRPDEAFQILDTLIVQKVEPILIMGTLISPFIDMYRAKLAIMAGQNPKNAAKYFEYTNKEFRLTNQIARVNKLSVNKLGKCLDILNEADIQLKSRAINPKLIIEKTMAKIMLAVI